MKSREYTLTREPESDVYRQILDFAVTRCAVALLVVRPDLALAAHGASVIQELKPLLRKTTETSEWPGTRLIGETAVLHSFTYNSESAGVLQKCSSGLFQWLQPNLPEDLCLLKSDEQPWLVSIAHERDGYFVLDEAEMMDLVANIPDRSTMIKNDRAGDMRSETRT